MGTATADVKLRLVIEAVNRTGRQIQQVAQQLSSVAEATEAAKKKTDTAGATGASAFQRWETALTKLKPKLDAIGKAGDSLRNAGQQLMLTGGAILGASVFPVAQAARFERAMKRVEAVTDGTEQDFDSLAKKATELGYSTRFSAVEAAGGMRALGQAGFDANQIIASIVPTLDLAAAGEISMAEASKYVVNILTTLKLPASDATRVVNNLALAANLTTTEVYDLAEAFTYAGPYMRSANIPLEKGSAILATYAQNGIDASRAGTAFRNLVVSLTKVVPAGQKVFDRLGVSVTKNTDGTVNLVKTLQDLKDAGATQADWVTIFRREFGGLQQLLADSIPMTERFEKALMNSEGAGRKMATTMEDNLIGSLYKLKNSVGALLTVLGDPLLKPLTDLTKVVIDLVKWLIEGSKQTESFTSGLIKLGTSTGGVLIAIGALLIPISALLKLIQFILAPIIAFVKVMGGLPAVIKTVTAAMTAFSGVVAAAALAAPGWALAIAAIGTAWVGWEIKKRIDEFVAWRAEMKKTKAAGAEYANAAHRAAEATKEFEGFEIPSFDVAERGMQTLASWARKTNQEMADLEAKTRGAFENALRRRELLEQKLLSEGLSRTAIRQNEEYRALSNRIELASKALKTLNDEQERRAKYPDESRFPMDRGGARVIDPEEMKKAEEAALKTSQMRADLIREDKARIREQLKWEIEAFKASEEAKALENVGWEDEVARRINAMKAKAEQQITDLTIDENRKRRSAVLKEAEIQAASELEVLEDSYEQGLVDLDVYLEQRSKLKLQKFDADLKELNAQLAEELDIDKKRDIVFEIKVVGAERIAELVKLDTEEKAIRRGRLEAERGFQRDLLQTKLAGIEPGDIQAQHDIEMELLRQQHADKIREMDRARASEKQMTDMAIAQRKEQMVAEANFEKQVLDVRLQGYQDMLASAQSIFSDLYTASNEKVKAFFYVERAVAMAEALVSAYSASAKALDSPFTKLNPMLGMAMSKMILIAGLSRAAMIGATALRGPGAWKGGFVDAVRRRHGGPVGWVPKPSPNRFVQAFATGGKVLNQIGKSATPAVREVTRVVGTTVLPHRDPSGLVRGPSGRDVIPAWLTNKEYVLRPEAVAQPGALPFLEAFNRGMITMKDLMASGLRVTRETVVREVQGPARRFATGGFVGGQAAGGSALGSLSVTVPVHATVNGGMDSKVLVSDLKSGIEETVVRIIKEHM